jgi:hypothetical protein
MSALSVIGSGVFMIACGSSALWGSAVMERRGWPVKFFKPTPLRVKLHRVAGHGLVIAGIVMAFLGVYRLSI